MLIGERLRALREAKGLSQGDIEKSTGLFRCYVSRVENDHTTPAIETLEKWARALEIPLYAIFYDGKKSAKPGVLPKSIRLLKSPGDVRFMKKLARSLSRMQERDQRLLLHAALKLASRKKPAHN
ncbi:MAG: helix-turn-helix transcriptional regulator [Candidatus Acidiferrales bacterium]